MYPFTAQRAAHENIDYFQSKLENQKITLFLQVHFVFIQRSQYIRAKVTAHKCEGIIRTQVLFEGGPYMRKYSNLLVD